MILAMQFPDRVQRWARRCVEVKNLAARGYFDGTAEHQYTGVIGEACFRRLCSGSWPDMSTPGHDNGVDLHLRIEGEREAVDVKTLARSVPIQEDFTHHFPTCQAHHPATVLVFLNRIKGQNTIEFCGWIYKRHALRNFPVIEKGQRRPCGYGRTFITKTQCVEIPQKDLRPIMAKRLNVQMETTTMDT